MYLRQRDYDRVINSDELQQYLNADSGIQSLAYYTALAKVKSHLKQKYYVDGNTETDPYAYDYEFSDTNVYSGAVSYVARNRVELNFPAYVDTNAYNPGDLASNGTNQYICKTATTGAFDASKWNLLGSLYDIWNLSLPYPLFRMPKKYAIGDIVYWKGYIYQALQPSTFFEQYERIQAVYDYELPYPNVFPDDPNYGATFWGIGVPYIVSGIAPNAPLSTYGSNYSGATTYDVVGNVGGNPSYAIQNNILYQALKLIPNTATIVPGTDITAWQPITWASGDNRDQLVIDILLHLTIFDLISRIMTDQTPQLRGDAFKRSLKLLESIEHGDITPDRLIQFQTNKGLTVTFGGSVKRGNQW